MRSAIGYALCLSLCLAAGLGCTRYKAKYSSPGEKGADPTNRGPGEPSSDVVPGGPATKTLADIQIESAKFAGQEAKLRAVVKFAGAEQQAPKLTPAGDVLSLTVDALPPAEKDVLTVELYEGEKLRFIARRAATTLTAQGENRIQIEDCLVLVAPWDGLGSDGGCNWSVEEASN